MRLATEPYHLYKPCWADRPPSLAALPTLAFLFSSSSLSSTANGSQQPRDQEGGQYIYIYPAGMCQEIQPAGTSRSGALVAAVAGPWPRAGRGRGSGRDNYYGGAVTGPVEDVLPQAITFAPRSSLAAARDGLW